SVEEDDVLPQAGQLEPEARGERGLADAPLAGGDRDDTPAGACHAAPQGGGLVGGRTTHAAALAATSEAMRPGSASSRSSGTLWPLVSQVSGSPVDSLSTGML